MSDKVEHLSVVKAVSGQYLTVSVEKGSMCHGCGIAAMCGSKGNGSEMIIKVDHAGLFNVGEKVKVIAAESAKWRAILLTAVFPCVLLLSVVMVSLALGVGETVSAASGICSLVIYFVVIYLFREKVINRLSWNVEKIES